MENGINTSLVLCLVYSLLSVAVWYKCGHYLLFVGHDKTINTNRASILYFYNEEHVHASQ